MNRKAYPPFVTTAVAAEYCGYKEASAIRKAHREGRVLPVGRRGGTGPWGCGRSKHSTDTCEGSHRLIQSRRTA